jgi:hypothetical protein
MKKKKAGVGQMLKAKSGTKMVSQQPGGKKKRKMPKRQKTVSQ